jgi:hypothetical protein
VTDLPTCLRGYSKQVELVYDRFKGVRDRDEIHRWLTNFEPKHARIALALLSEFVFIPEDQTKDLCRHLFGRLTRLGVKAPCFFDFGPPAKSGAFVAYYFRISNELSAENFFSFAHLEAVDFDRYDTVVLLDDFVGSGNQALGFWVASFAHLAPDKRVIYLALAGLANGRKDIEQYTRIEVLLGRELTEADQAFHTANVFKDCHEADEARDIIREYGRFLFPEHPLGYGDSQVMIAFSHNTPNNTLPIFWSKLTNWSPLFERLEPPPNVAPEIGIGPAPSANELAAAEKHLGLREVLYAWEDPSEAQAFDHLTKLGKMARVSHGEQTLYMLPEAAICFCALHNEHPDIAAVAHATGLKAKRVKAASKTLAALFEWQKGNLVWLPQSCQMVVFDWSDTLVDEYDLDEAVCEFITLDAGGSREKSTENKVRFREMLHELEQRHDALWYDYVYLGQQFQKTPDSLWEFHRRSSEKLRPLVDFPRLAGEFRDRGIKVGIATNCVSQVLHWRAKLLGWPLEDLCNTLITSDQYGAAQ